jgi:hypothetical protein
MLAYDPPPVPPLEPEPGACCQSGCDPCVYDLYWEAVDRYEQALAAWQARQAASTMPPPSAEKST